MKSISIKSTLLVLAFGLVACDSNKKQSVGVVSSSSIANNVLGNNNVSLATASSSLMASNVMVLNKEYPYTENTKITNMGKTALIINKKHYWDTNKTVVILTQGSATID